MSEIVVHRRHGVRLTRAKELAEKMARRLRDEFGGSYRWDGNTLRFRRAGATGHVAVRQGDIEIRVDIGFLLTPLRGRIEREIVAFCDEHLTPPAPARRAQPARPTASRSGSTRSSRSQGGSSS